MACNVTLTHCHVVQIPNQFFVLNRFGGRSVFCQMYRLKLINRQIWESLILKCVDSFVSSVLCSKDNVHDYIRKSTMRNLLPVIQSGF